MDGAELCALVSILLINEVVPATGAVAIVVHALAECCTHEPHVPSILALDSVPVLSSYNSKEYLNLTPLGLPAIASTVFLW